MIPLLGLLPLVGNIANKIADHFLPPSMSEEEKKASELKLQGLLYEQMMGPMQAELNDLADARASERVALQNAGKLMNSLRASVTIVGGHGAQGVLLWNIVSPYFGYQRVAVSVEEFAILGGIIAFYYGKRLKEKLAGVSAAQ